MVKKGKLFMGETLDFWFELTGEKGLEKELNENFEEAVWKITRMMFAKTVFFELTS